MNSNSVATDEDSATGLTGVDMLIPFCEGFFRSLAIFIDQS